MIGKSGLVLNLVPFVGPPLAQVLSQLESVVDVSRQSTSIAYYALHMSLLEATTSLAPKTFTLELTQARFVQTIAFELISLVPDNADAATNQKDSIDVTLASAIDSWSGGITVTA